MVGDTEKEKAMSQCTKEAKKARREIDKVQNRKARCGVITSQIYTFMFDSTVVLLELTRSARCEASCACVILYAFTIMILGRWKGDLFSRGPHPTRFVYLANFSLWFMLLLIHKVATYITVELF